MHILIADDDPTGLAVSRHLATVAGHAVEVAVDGAAALRAIATGQFDAALIDLYMPILDGAAVARAVSAILPAERRPRLIALTAASQPGGAAAISALGFDAYLTKPLSLAALDAALTGGAPPPTYPVIAPPSAPPAVAMRPAPTDVSSLLLAAHAAGDTAALATHAAALKAATAAGKPALAALAARLELALAAADAAAVDYLVRAITAE